ncbi:4'-phosphopantetheinyl transferase superfamily protein [Luteibacter sp. CQ10]|uniref:4'-phosphopantetheinyl transferase superfamily protein n=1 Tax=Luteibacter sp. CQ10 TaxID=2805821 RepID=UPI0034A2BF23
MSTRSLLPGEVHLWMARYPQFDDPVARARCDAVMSDEERSQTERFYFPDDRLRHRVTRALLRNTLSRYAPVEAGAWRFTVNAYGRPAIDPGHGEARALSFNLSHTRGLIVLAVARDIDLGVDVENIRHRAAPLDIADRFFSTEEVAALAMLEAEARPRRFYEYWTLKESYIKARGMGLSLPLDGFAFSYTATDAIALAIDPALADDPERWEFWQWHPIDDCLIALCIQRRGDTVARIQARLALPEGDAPIPLVPLRRSPAPVLRPR